MIPMTALKLSPRKIKISRAAQQHMGITFARSRNGDMMILCPRTGTLIEINKTEGRLLKGILDAKPSPFPPGRSCG